MAKGTGKAFEEDFKRSLCKTIYPLRLKDSASSWNGGTMSRFTIKNPCDFVLYNPSNRQMYMLELKHTNSKSLPFGNIKKNQIEGLTKSDKFGIVSGFVIKTKDGTFYLDIKDFNEFVATTSRKSIPLELLSTKGIFIPSEKIRKNYRYDLSPITDMVRSD
jgi:penicillin-binding protein-related factor A (putative recombinase)